MENIFQDLFVLEMAHNHRGSVDRAKEIIDKHYAEIKYLGAKVAVKLQLRDKDTHVHPDAQAKDAHGYCGKYRDTTLSNADVQTVVSYIREVGLIPMATVFDDASVDLAEELEIPILKLASSSIGDQFLVGRLAETDTPVVLSTGGRPEKQLVHTILCAIDVLGWDRDIAINHCVSIHPCPQEELNMGQITLLKQRFPGCTIGFSSHEGRHHITESINMAYALGARTFERHIDIMTPGRNIATPGIEPALYNLLPWQTAAWIEAAETAKGMLKGGSDPTHESEATYLAERFRRGVYALDDIPEGVRLTKHNTFLALPWKQGQLSTHDWVSGRCLTKPIQKGGAIYVEDTLK